MPKKLKICTNGYHVNGDPNCHCDEKQADCQECMNDFDEFGSLNMCDKCEKKSKKKLVKLVNKATASKEFHDMYHGTSSDDEYEEMIIRTKCEKLTKKKCTPSTHTSSS